VRVVARAIGLGLVAVVVGVGTVVGSVLFAPAAAARVPVPVATAGNSARTPLATRYADNRAAMLAYGAPYAGWATGDRQFLLFDPRGDGLVAEVFGDLSTADRIAVLVPGVDTRGTNFVTGLGGVAERAPATQAANLYQTLTNQPATDQPATGTGGQAAGQVGGGGARVAVVAWLGYFTPHGVGRDAAREELARAGAVALDRFLGTLTHQRPSAGITLIGHSYGSVVIGLAAPHLPRQVTDLVAIGSPGMGVDSAADLHTAARVWAGLSPADWIRWVPGVEFLGVGHDTQPADPSFGARPFATTGVTNHDRYLSPGTASLTNIAAITLDHDNEVTR
jgi:pimeloyl-ACP methyl ester carboxylesterase